MLLRLCLLLTLSAAAQAPAAPKSDEPRPCSGDDCRWGADKDGFPAFWAARGRDGKFEAGFDSLLRQQKRYNKWAHGNERSDRFPGVNWTENKRGGWQGARVVAPRWIAEDGRVTPETLRIPIYYDGAELLRLWENWRKDCRRNASDDDAPACKPEAGAPGPDPYSPLLKERAAALRRGLEASRDYERKISSLDQYVVEAKDSLNRELTTRYDFSRFPKPVLSELEALSKTVEESLAQGRRLEDRYKAEKDPFE